MDFMCVMSSHNLFCVTMLKQLRKVSLKLKGPIRIALNSLARETTSCREHQQLSNWLTEPYEPELLLQGQRYFNRKKKDDSNKNKKKLNNNNNKTVYTMRRYCPKFYICLNTNFQNKGRIQE